jgi:tRNA C32,U32 (ribose-2'-O)-methylase TrmJ
LVFGNEQNGLDNEELALCTHQVTVPTVKHFKSLNLASCVQLVSYTVSHGLRKRGGIQEGKTTDSQQLASHAQINAVNSTISNLVFRADPNKTQLDTSKLRQILFRSELTADEVNFLHGMLKRLLKGAS